MNNKYSVLLSLYYKEKPNFFEESLNSILNQTLKPQQVLVVVDGKITSELQSILDKYASQIETVYLKENRGLGYSLNVGLTYCTCDYIARMDTDDIAIPDRMEKQVRYLNENPNISAIGGYIAEFQKTIQENKKKIRVVPTDNQKIERFSQFRNPMNHPTVMFRKQDVIDVGNYQMCEGFEDYYLWIRMIINGKKITNLNQIVLYSRVGNDLIKRRSGFKYLKQEVRFQKKIHKIGFIANKQLIINVCVRGIMRLLPRGIISNLYNVFFRKRG